MSLTPAGDALFVQSLSTSLWRINITGSVDGSGDGNLTLTGAWSCLYYTCSCRAIGVRHSSFSCMRRAYASCAPHAPRILVSMSVAWVRCVCCSCELPVRQH